MKSELKLSHLPGLEINRVKSGQVSTAEALLKLSHVC